MSDFNPTKNDLLDLDSIILGIKQRKQKLIDRKINLQNQLSGLNNQYKGIEFNGPEFNAIKNKRASLKEIYNEVELKISKINEELLFKNKLRSEVEFYLKNNKKLESREDFDRLQAKTTILIKKYRSFSKDRTRIASLRVMASEIADELEGLFK